MKLTHKLVILVCFVLFISACDNNNLKPSAIIPSESQASYSTSQPKTIIPVTDTNCPTPQWNTYCLDPDSYFGIVVVTQYYTFLGHDLHESAYNLLSSSAQKNQGLESYLQMAKMTFKSVEIVSIIPYELSVMSQGGQISSIPVNKKRFAVQIKAWGEGNMSGSKKNGDLQDLFLELVKENGQWRIETFSSAPLQ